MIRTKVLTKRGVREGTLNDLRTNTNFTIIDYLNPSNKELNDISKQISIPVSELKDSYARDTRPRSQDIGNYFELTIRAATRKKNNGIEFQTISFFVSYKKNNIIILHDKKDPAIDAVLALDDKTLLFHLRDGKARIVFRFLSEVIRKAEESLEYVEDEVDKIEKGIFRKGDHTFLSQVFSAKKTLIVFHKEFAANREAINNLHLAFNITKEYMNEIADLKSDISQIIDTIGTFRELINGTMEVHLSVMSHNMNKIMKRLTGIGALIIVPTLIASIYGMNFSYMPELTWKWGYFVTLGAMALISTALFFFFRHKEWI